MIGLPETAEVERDPDTGVVSFVIYDAKGLTCGGAEFHPDGRVIWSLIRGAEAVKYGRDDPCEFCGATREPKS